MAIDKSIKEEAMLYFDVLEVDSDKWLNEQYKKFIDENKSEFKKKVKELIKLFK